MRPGQILAHPRRVVSKLNIAEKSLKFLPKRLCFFNFVFDVMHKACFEDQAAAALSQLLSDGHYTTELKDALVVLLVMTTENAKDAKCSCKRISLHGWGN